MTRPVATSDDYISIKEARAIFTSKGRSITERTLQRYCGKHYLDGQKRVTAEGEKWFVLKSSVLTRIAELDEFDRLRPVPTNDDTSAVVVEEIQRHDTLDEQRHNAPENMSAPVARSEQSHTTASDLPRQDATGRDTSNTRETSARNGESIVSERE